MARTRSSAQEQLQTLSQKKQALFYVGQLGLGHDARAVAVFVVDLCGSAASSTASGLSWLLNWGGETRLSTSFTERSCGSRDWRGTLSLRLETTGIWHLVKLRRMLLFYVHNATHTQLILGLGDQRLISNNILSAFARFALSDMALTST